MTRRTGVVGVALATSLACASPGTPAGDAASPMTAALLQETLRSLDAQASSRGNSLEFTFSGVRLSCIWDEDNGRMRIIAPVKRLADVSPKQLAAIFDANFHSALDARYGTSQQIVYAAFIHPLPSLSLAELHSAVRQVASLVLTFGTTYSSGALVYHDPGQAL